MAVLYSRILFVCLFVCLLIYLFIYLFALPCLSFQEIIVKAISGVLFLLLKHFKLNHVYQVSCF